MSAQNKSEKWYFLQNVFSKVCKYYDILTFCEEARRCRVYRKIIIGIDLNFKKAVEAM